jgi:hypothetical protein
MPTAPPEGRMLYDTAANAPLKKKRPSRQPEGKLLRLRRDPPATGDGRYGPGTLYGLWPRSRWLEFTHDRPSGSQVGRGKDRSRR